MHNVIAMNKNKYVLVLNALIIIKYTYTNVKVNQEL